MATSPRPKGTAKKSEKFTHGILVLHGAGMPEDQTKIVGDPLSTIANGLIAYLDQGEPAHRTIWEAARAEVRENNLAGLDIDVFRMPASGKPTKPEYKIRMREVLWKPTMPNHGLLEYLPLLWLWAFAFESHAVRKVEADKQKQRGVNDRGDNDRQDVEKESQDTRRLADLESRVAIAVFGFIATLLDAFIVGEVVKWFNPQWTSISPEFVRLWQITTSVIAWSLVAAILLVLLATQELRDRKVGKPHGSVHLMAIILSTTWLAPFLVPWLLVLYYFDRVLIFVLLLGLVAGVILVSLRVETWELRVAFLLSVAFVIWLVIWARSSEAFAERASRLAEAGVRPVVIGWLIGLLVIAGAPLIICLILALELLSLLPIGGDSFHKLAQSLSQASTWIVLKDIYVYLTDSSRSALARYRVEEGIKELSQDVDTIHIFAHSLGTVVAYETLVNVGRGNGALIKKGDSTYEKIRTLVTYGSPLNKVRILADVTAKSTQIMSGFDYLRFDHSAQLAEDLYDFDWLNFYALQDVVSDELSLYARPEDPIHPCEFCVESAQDIMTAHGVYWTDNGFWKATLETIGFDDRRPVA